MDISEWEGSPQDGQGAGEHEVWAETGKAKGDLIAVSSNLVENIERTLPGVLWQRAEVETEEILIRWKEKGFHREADCSWAQN